MTEQHTLSFWSEEERYGDRVDSWKETEVADIFDPSYYNLNHAALQSHSPFREVATAQSLLLRISIGGA
jgi:hypothetical protein